MFGLLGSQQVLANLCSRQSWSRCKRIFDRPPWCWQVGPRHGSILSRWALVLAWSVRRSNMAAWSCWPSNLYTSCLSGWGMCLTTAAPLELMPTATFISHASVCSQVIISDSGIIRGRAYHDDAWNVNDQHVHICISWDSAMSRCDLENHIWASTN